MMRFIMPAILIGISVSLFFAFTNFLYNDVLLLRVEAASYDEALNNSKILESERDKLAAKYSSISPENLAKLQKFLPDTVDNIRLILEIEQIVSPYGMALKDVKYNIITAESAARSATPGASRAPGAGAAQASRQDYGAWDLEFSTIGTYNNFLNFMKDLEGNLRLVDISSIQFSSTSDTRLNVPSNLLPAEGYKYNFKIKTYWLRN